MIALIAAYGENQVIGKNNSLPWHLPNDLKHFKELTIGKTIVMGRTTYESIGRPLPNRKNVVLTHNPSFTAKGVEVVHQIDDVLALGNVMIIGGASIYKQFLPYVTDLYITEIHHAFQGDTFFPNWDKKNYRLIDIQKGTVDEKNIYPHTFLHYKKW